MNANEEKKLPMATLQETLKLLEAAVEELRTQYSFYPDLNSFPSLLQLVQFLHVIGEDHPYLPVYEQKLDRIAERYVGSDPSIMHVSFAEANERFVEALMLGRKMGIIDVESRGSRNGGGSGTLRVERAAPEIFLLPWIEERIWKKQQNAMIAIVGLPGSGKSYAAIEIARLLVERSRNRENKFTFDIEVHVIFDIQTLIDIAYGRVPLPRGTIIIFDDAGVGAGNRDWQDAYNVIMGKIAQSFRFMGFVFFVTVPKTQFIDKQVREVLQAKLISVTNERGESDIGTFSVEVAYQDGEDILFYPPEMKYTDFPAEQGYEIHGDDMRLYSFHFSKPPEELTEPYEQKKQRELKGQVNELKTAIEEAEAMNRAKLDAMTERYNRMIDEGARTLEERKREVEMLALEAKAKKSEAQIIVAEQEKDRAMRKMTKQKWIDPKDLIIIEGVKSGETLQKVAAKIGISVASVHQRKKRLEAEGRLDAH